MEKQGEIGITSIEKLSELSIKNLEWKIENSKFGLIGWLWKGVNENPTVLRRKEEKLDDLVYWLYETAKTEFPRIRLRPSNGE